jgi:hypothetical protein
MVEKEMQGDVDPTKVFYIALSADYLDGSAGVSWDGSQGFQSLEEAIEHAREEAHEHGTNEIIVQCTPIRRVCRAPVRVITIKPRS